MDNAKIYHTQNIIDFFNRNNYTIRHLPPYSTQLNPVEENFSTIKKRYNKVKTRPQNTDEIKNLIKSVNYEMNKDPKIQYIKHYDSMLKYLDKAQNRIQF